MSASRLGRLTGQGRVRHGEILADAARLAEAGELVPALDPGRFALETVNDAYRAFRERSTRGKIIVDVLAG
jgi:NADPH:quinone reductase